MVCILVYHEIPISLYAFPVGWMLGKLCPSSQIGPIQIQILTDDLWGRAARLGIEDGPSYSQSDTYLQPASYRILFSRSPRILMSLITPLDECWYASSQLYLTCHLRPTGGRQPKGRHMHGEDDIRVDLELYSTFEHLDLPGSSPLENNKNSFLGRAETVPSPTPIPYVGPVSNVLQGACALDALFPRLQVYTYHPTQA